MKAKTFFVITGIFAFVFSFVSCMTTVQKTAIKFAEDITFNAERLAVVEKPAFVYSGYVSQDEGVGIGNMYRGAKRVVTIPGGLGATGYMVSSGYSEFIVYERNVDFFFQWKKITTHTTRMSFTFEEGKCYELRFGVIKEMTDPAMIEKGQRALEAGKNVIEKDKAEKEKSIEREKEYLAFSEANPGYLDGKWESKETKLTFKGSRVYVESFRLEGAGSYFFDKNTIVAFIEWITIYDRTGDMDPPQKYVWYYEFEGDVLKIAKGVFSIRNIKGQYHKSE
jgi:hypothetical protein